MTNQADIHISGQEITLSKSTSLQRGECTQNCSTSPSRLFELERREKLPSTPINFMGISTNPAPGTTSRWVAFGGADESAEHPVAGLKNVLTSLEWWECKGYSLVNVYRTISLPEGNYPKIADHFKWLDHYHVSEMTPHVTWWKIGKLTSDLNDFGVWKLVFCRNWNSWSFCTQDLGHLLYNGGYCYYQKLWKRWYVKLHLHIIPYPYGFVCKYSTPNSNGLWMIDYLNPHEKTCFPFSVYAETDFPQERRWWSSLWDSRFGSRSTWKCCEPPKSSQVCISFPIQKLGSS